MIGPSKILTVSYGTFSCTLEGFDDPFSTMRGIAEYFRDLAADDRYFGAEPPTPDAEMLHRIAEREVNKRVEARIEDNSVTLRQTDEDMADGRAAHAPAPSAPVAPATARGAPEVLEPAKTVADPVDLPPVNDPAPAHTESVAEKLARIRAVVASDRVGDADVYVQDDASEVFASSPISAVFNTDEADQEDAGIVPETALAETQESVDPVSDSEAHAGPDMDMDADSENETVGKGDTTVEDFFANTQNLSPTASDEDGDTDQGDDGNADLAQQFSQASNDEDTEEAGASSEHDVVEAEIADADRVADTATGEEDAATDAPALARVVKMRREDFDAAMESGDMQDDFVNQDEDSDDEEDTDGATTLSAQDEAELMSNLEQVQRKAQADVRAEKEGRALLENQDIEASAGAVSRILDVTNNELAETEGTRRRSAIAHLKAAVAATRADKFLSKKREVEDADEMNEYRDDLAKVVRPRRPSENGQTTSRRLAPLVLVSEQRVDEAQVVQASDGASITPRRITAGNLALDNDDEQATDGTPEENIFREENSFAEFAAEMGARELPDLLEAAAAYSSYIEGRAHFSRPQIMKAVAEMNADQDFTREEGLRSFGLLLRRGKIKKIKRGQFTIAATTRFNPEQRAVGE